MEKIRKIDIQSPRWNMPWFKPFWKKSELNEFLACANGYADCLSLEYGKKSVTEEDYPKFHITNISGAYVHIQILNEFVELDENGYDVNLPF